jgi:hypothetical protein
MERAGCWAKRNRDRREDQIIGSLAGMDDERRCMLLRYSSVDNAAPRANGTACALSRMALRYASLDSVIAPRWASIAS